MLKFTITAICVVGLLAMLLFMLAALVGLQEAQDLQCALRACVDNR